MHYASTPEPLQAPSAPAPQKCTLHDGTWPLEAFVAQLRGQASAPVLARRPDLTAISEPAGPVRPAAASRPDASPAINAAPAQRLSSAAPAQRPSSAAPAQRPSPAAAPAQGAAPAPVGRRRRKRSADSRQLIPPQASPVLARSNGPGPDPRLVRLRREAEELVRRGRLGDALSRMREAMAIDRNHGPTLAYCGWLMAQASPDNAERSQQMLERAVRCAPRKPSVYYFRGMALKALGEADKAVASFERALELDPDDMRSARELRLHGLRQKQAEEAPGLIGWLKRR